MKKKTVLLVDDEPSIRIVLTAVLEQAGYSVVTADDGFAALRKVQQSKPDAVITDLRMPNMNGFELLTVLRSRYPEIPTIAISGEFAASQVNSGPIADAFFQKGSYRIPEFLDKLSDLLAGPLQRSTSTRSAVWAPIKDAPVMLTCTNCLRTFPIDACDGTLQLKKTDCIFCGTSLDVEVVAVGMVHGGSR